MIAIVTALPEELSPLLKRARVERRLRIGRHRAYVGTLGGTPVVLMTTGDGVEQAERALAELLRQVDVSMVLGAGIAGALSPELRTGDVVVAEQVVGADAKWECDRTFSGHGRAAVLYTSREIIRTAEAKRKLFLECGGHATARSQKSGGMATALQMAIDTESAGWARAASERRLPFAVIRVIFDSAGQELSPAIRSPIARQAIAWHAMLHPRVIPELLRMRKRLRECAHILSDFVMSRVAPAPVAQLEHFLQTTSRTFALCVPLLPQPTRFEVTVAYLLFRIADTFEDASELPVATRTQALMDFCALLRNPEPAEAERRAAEWRSNHPTSHAGYLELLAHVPAVLEGFRSLSPLAMGVIRTHVIRSAEGMAQYVSRTAPDGKLQLDGIDDLRRYCYTVAGIVGEMLTELFLLGSPQLASAATFLRARSALFGEALQLVNILKDAADDRSEGRQYIPRGAKLADVFALARADLEVATEYTLMMHSEGAPRGVIAFAALPVALAEATLDRVEKFGPGAKVSRTEVFRITRRLNRSLARNEPPLRKKMERSSGLRWMRA